MTKNISIFYITLFSIFIISISPCFSNTIDNEILSYQNKNRISNIEWEQVVDQGFGNNNNLHAWAMKEYKGFIYAGTRNVVDGCQIYRSETGDNNTWIKVNLDGFDTDNKSEGARHMIVYANLLWVITISWEFGAQVWVTNGEDSDADGILNWKKANTNGFGQGNVTIETRGLAIFNDKLYVGSGSKDNHPLLYRYDGPTEFNTIDPTKWTLVKDWYEDPNYSSNLFLVGDLYNFTSFDGKNYLYVSIITGVTPLHRDLIDNFSIINLLKTLKIMLFEKGQIWRYDSINWELVGKEVFKTTNQMVSTFVALNKSLYVGTANWFGGEIWKTEDGINWKQVIKRGFYSPFNFWIWKLFNYNNRIIAGTLNPVLGCEIWASKNDFPMRQRDFIKIGRHGMDGANIFTTGELPQDGARSFEIFNGTLYVGTTNWVDLNSNLKGTGCEIWRIKNDEKYQYNN